MDLSESERIRIRAEERTRISARLVSSIGNLLLSDLENSESSKESGREKSKPEVKKNETNKPQRTRQKNKQRGSQSLSNLSTLPKAKITSVSNRPKPTQNSNSRRAFQQRVLPTEPPSYNESYKHINQAGIPSLFSTPGSALLPDSYPPHPTSYINLDRNRPPPLMPPYSIHGSEMHSVAFGNILNVSQSSHQPKRNPSNSVNIESLGACKTVTFGKEAGCGDNLGHRQRKKKSTTRRTIDVNMVVRELSECEGFFCFLKKISQKLNINGDDLLKFVRENNHVFSTLNDPDKRDSIIELCPKVKLCDDHQKHGCNRLNCLKIHLCEDFIYSGCVRKDCPLGHTNNFKSNHNQNILNKYYICLLPNKTLQQLLQKGCAKNQTLQICFDYYKGNCKFAEKCKFLHICYSYVNTLGFCSNENCTLSHDIRDVKIVIFLKSLGVSTNECPRDILKTLKDKCIIKGKDNYIKEAPQKAVVDDTLKGDIKECQIHENVKNKKAGDNQQTENTTEKDKKARVKQQTENATVHCTDFHGSVKKTKICMDGLKSTCKFALTGCHLLHCSHKSHWQFGNGDKWYNFDEYHSQILDSRYSDPNCSDLSLPKLDISRLNTQQKNLITLMGKRKLEINFSNMTFFCESTDTSYCIRNLTTKTSAIANEDDEIDNFTIFKWYNQNDDGLWDLFDNSDFSSSLMEQNYYKFPNAVYKFRANASYQIDFKNMTQENEATHKISSLRRRPFFPSKEMNANEGHL